MMEYILYVGDDEETPTVISGLPHARTRAELAKKLGVGTIRLGVITYPLRELQQRSSYPLEDSDTKSKAIWGASGAVVGGVVGGSATTTLIGAALGVVGDSVLDKRRNEELAQAKLFNSSLDPNDKESVTLKALLLWFESMNRSYLSLSRAVGHGDNYASSAWWVDIFAGTTKVPVYVTNNIPAEYYSMAVDVIANA